MNPLSGRRRTVVLGIGGGSNIVYHHTLWQFKTGSSINSTAITYTHDGRQYVSVTSGLRGVLANRYAAGQVPAGGSVWTFALMPE